MQLYRVLLLCLALSGLACVDQQTIHQAALATSIPTTVVDKHRGVGGTRDRTKAPEQLPAERIALVIGNSAYAPSMALKSPVNDAQAMAKTLRILGFKVTQLENANLTMMRDAIRSFDDKLAQSRGIGLFYFAGHGVGSKSGLNYLIPVDYQLGSNLDTTAVDADSVRESMEKSNDALNIAILDACRNNPFQERALGVGVRRGLAPMQASGSLIALATAPGAVAIESDANGLYTHHILKYILVPGIDIKEMFDRVGEAVARDTNNEQRPWYNTSVQGSFTFVPLGTVVPESPELPAAPTTGTTGAGRSVLIDFAMFYDNGTGKPVQLRNGAKLRSGDGYFFHIKTSSNNQNYLYLFQVDSTRKVFRLFPSTQYHTAQNPVPANTPLTIPNEREVFFLDDTNGEEKFYFVVSNSPILPLEHLENGTLDDIMDAGVILRGPKGVRAKIATVATRLGEVNLETSEFSFTDNLTHILTIDHQ